MNGMEWHGMAWNGMEWNGMGMGMEWESESESESEWEWEWEWNASRDGWHRNGLEHAGKQYACKKGTPPPKSLRKKFVRGI